MYYVTDYFTDEIITCTDDLDIAIRLCNLYSGSQVEDDNDEIYHTNI